MTLFTWCNLSFTQCGVRLRFLRYRNWIVWLLMTLFTWCNLSFTQCDVRLRFLRYRNWIVWLLMTLFTWCDLLCMQCILVCDVTHEWFPYLFCVIAMCDSNVSTLQIASKLITPCEQFHKNACIKLLSHANRIARCERTFKPCCWHTFTERCLTTQFKARRSHNVVFYSTNGNS